MKKLMLTLAMLVGITAQAFSTAYAVPTVDGMLGAGEYLNAGYPFYIQVTDPNEVAIPDAYDISRATLLQVITGGVGDGVYIAIETYGIASLVDADGVGALAQITATVDFDGDGFGDLTLVHYNLAPGAPAASDKVEICFGSFCIPTTGTDITTASGAYLDFGSYARAGSIIEYYIPSGSFLTPVGVPIPYTFIGSIVYDNGSAAEDDFVLAHGSAIPEPGTMLMLGAGLLGLVGFRRFSK